MLRRFLIAGCASCCLSTGSACVGAGDWHSSPVRPARWTIFSADGILLGEVELPPRFVPHVSGDDFVAGVYRDDAQVEYVHVYELEK